MPGVVIEKRKRQRNRESQSSCSLASAAIGDIVDILQSDAGNTGTRTAVATVVAGAASGIGQQLVTRTTGAILNPNMELLFNSPALRQFSFQFQLSARERDESIEIMKILI